MIRLLRLALTLPPHVVARRAAALVLDRSRSAIARRRDRRRPSRSADPACPLAPLLPAVPAGLLEPHRNWVMAAAERHRRGSFDLLGSGWTPMIHGLSPKGVGGYVYPAGPAVAADRDGHWLEGRLARPALAESRRLWSMTSSRHQPIDWHVDAKSGHRWPEDCWYKDIAIGHLPGVDVKVPWELGRLHHLVTLAWARALDPTGGWESVFRDHVLDFLAANPPRFGVNWRCTMDVAIRAANLVMAWDLMRVAGAVFDAAFSEALARSLVDHGRHIVDNLEKYPEGRGNHYLANICGLAFVAAALPTAPQAPAWAALAERELGAEIDYQFHPDGSNFEASTCYHRLSAEMVAMASALLAGQGRKGPAAWASRLGAMADFTRGVTKPGGSVAQVGDNDSGRFLKLQPAYDLQLAEDDLDHRHLLAAIGGLLGRADLLAAAGPFDLDAWVTEGLARGRLAAEPSAAPRSGPRLEALPQGGRRIVLRPGGRGLAEGLVCLAWPDFGYYVMRSGRVWLGIRCGAIGQNGRGGHAHNDQLAVEVSMDGADWIADPGTWLYTSLPAERNRYRSAAAHFVPRLDGVEPGNLGLGLFWLGNEARARCLHFGPEGFVGEHHGHGRPVLRRIWIEDDQVVIADQGHMDRGTDLVVSSAAEARALVPDAPPFSPGYGKQVRTP